ncbi:MAG: hypothetical protein AB7F43_06110 [Bacteriovoracia bacterium]
MSKSNFIRPMHPKTEIRPEESAIVRILSAGWIGQTKIHGHRAQIHISSSESEEPIAFNRQGQPHKKLLPADVVRELRRIFLPESDWSAIDAEWLKDKNKLFVFDYIKKDGVVLNRMTYEQRYQLLPKNFISPYVQILPILKTLEDCLSVLNSDKPEIEGLVFKSIDTPGFADTSIVRCRKEGSRV